MAQPYIQHHRGMNVYLTEEELILLREVRDAKKYDYDVVDALSSKWRALPDYEQKKVVSKRRARRILSKILKSPIVAFLAAISGSTTQSIYFD
jgi:hypothetical protein